MAPAAKRGQKQAAAAAAQAADTTAAATLGARTSSDRSPAAGAVEPDPKRLEPAPASRSLFPPQKTPAGAAPAAPSEQQRASARKDSVDGLFSTPAGEPGVVPARYSQCKDAAWCYTRGHFDGRAGRAFKEVWDKDVYPNREAFSDGYDSGYALYWEKVEKVVAPATREARSAADLASMF